MFTYFNPVPAQVEPVKESPSKSVSSKPDKKPLTDAEKVARMKGMGASSQYKVRTRGKMDQSFRSNMQ